MQREALHVDAEKSLVEALKIMATHNLRSLPVTNNNRLVGIIYRHTIENVLDCCENNADALKVSEFMHNKFLFAEEDMNLDAAAHKMIKSGLSRMPIVTSESTMEFVGILTSTDILLAKKKQ